MKNKDLICSIKGYQKVVCTSDGCVRLQYISATDHAKGVPTKQHLTNTYAVKI